MPDWDGIWESTKPYLILSGCLVAFIAWLWMCVGGTIQLVAVTGRLQCDSDPDNIANVTVRLLEIDTAPIRYIKMAQIKTNETGEFQMTGAAVDLYGTIEAVVRIFHYCHVNRTETDCYRKLTYNVPPEYVMLSRAEGKLFDIGVINLDTIQPNEETFCGLLEPKKSIHAV